jgi:hypothetical protein
VGDVEEEEYEDIVNDIESEFDSELGPIQMKPDVPNEDGEMFS